MYELEDCYYPLLLGIEYTYNLETGFKDADAVLVLGSKPRGPN